MRRSCFFAPLANFYFAEHCKAREWPSFFIMKPDVSNGTWHFKLQISIPVLPISCNSQVVELGVGVPAHSEGNRNDLVEEIQSLFFRIRRYMGQLPDRPTVCTYSTQMDYGMALD